MDMSRDGDLVQQGVRSRLRQSLFGVESPPPTIGRFVFLRPLGTGGMGTVSAAYDPSLRREVAIKVVRRTDAPMAHKHLLAEARAMAKVTHPNVIAVYEVGEFEGAVFIAMELVDGPTLHQWGKGEHEMRERIAAVIQAAEGLAAAHTAGLLHCDFKPLNCIIDQEGRVRVLDFGLSRALAWSPTFSSTGTGSTEAPGPTGAPTAIGGTPRYMAPEQARGEAFDARSDQFSFGVSAFELLTGRHPFGADSGRYDPREGGTMALDWDDTGVPRHVRNVLTRALQRDPEQRYPSMSVLVAVLRTDPSASRRVFSLVAATAGVAVVSGALGFTSASEQPDSRCDTSELAHAWNQERRNRIETAFRSHALLYGDTAWRGVEAALDKYAGQLEARLQTVCETQASDPRPMRATALRQECLDQRTFEFEASVSVFEEADEDVVRRWTRVVDGLGRLTRCDDVPELLAVEVAPAPQEQATAVSAVYARLARANALSVAGKQEEALTVSEQTLVDARLTEYGPAIARALMRLANSHRIGRRAADAKPLIEEAFAVATRSNDREVAFGAAASMVWVCGVLETDDSAVAAWSTVTEAVLAAAGNSPRLRFQWLTARAAVAMRRGDAAKALSLFEERESLVAAHPNSDPSPGRGGSDLASALAAAGRLPEARARILSALAIDRQRVGDEHPDYATDLATAGIIEAKLERPSDALEYMRNAERIWRRTLPPNHPDLSSLEINIAAALGDLARDQEAVDLLTQTVEALRTTYSDDHPLVGKASENLARSLAKLGRPEDARAAYTRAQEIYEARFGAEHPETHRVTKALSEL